MAYWAHICEQKIIKQFLSSTQEQFPEVNLYCMPTSRNDHVEYEAGDKDCYHLTKNYLSIFDARI